MPNVFMPLYSTVLRIPRLRSFLPSSDDRQHWKLRTKSIMWRPRWTQQEAEGPSRGLSGHDLPSYAPARHGYPCFASLHGYTHPYESDEEDSWSEEESEDPIPRFLFSGYVELTTARIYKVMASTGILEVESDLIVGTSARVFFQRNALCLNETRVKSGAPLHDLLRDYLTEPCSCVARPFAKRNGTFRRITGVEVHLIARKVWIGTRSSQPVVSGRHAKTERVIVSKNVERDCSPPACNMQISKAAPQACTIFQGEVLYVEASAGVLEKADGDGAVFYAHQCFLFGVCLRDVHLADVLPKGKRVLYEVSDDEKGLRSVKIGTGTLEADDLYFTLKAWCRSNNTPRDTTNTLLCMAGWLPDDLNPTIDQWECKEVVDAGHWSGPGSQDRNRRNFTKKRNVLDFY